MPKLYARLEPTTDKTILEMEPEKAKAKRDVQLYADDGCTFKVGRYEWWHTKPNKSTKAVSLDDVTWELVWLPDL